MDIHRARSRLVVHFFQQQASAAFAFHQISDGAGDQEEMASVVGTFVPTYQGLAATHLIGRPSALEAPFPFSAPRRIAYYRARNAIYHLFRTLRTTQQYLTVIAPDYYSRHEIVTNM